MTAGRSLVLFASVAIVSWVAAACAAPSSSGERASPATEPRSSRAAGEAAASARRPDVSAPASPAGADPPSAAAAFAKLRADITACYEDGRRAVPTMTAGKVTFHAAVDPSGATTCVVPSDDSGLTQEVEDCMRKRIAREAHAPSAGAWSLVVPIVVDGGTVALGSPATRPLIETIESHGLGEDVYDVVARLVPELRSCFAAMESSADLRVVYLGAEVRGDGRIACALASSQSAIPEGVRACAASVLGRASFRPPQRGHGLVSIPLQVLGRK